MLDALSRLTSPSAGSVTVPAGAPSQPSPITAWGAITTASVAVSVYHGVKRNHGSIGWGLGWGLAAAVAPVVVPVVALAQGYAKPESDR